jgi:hypothetical protein
MQTRLLSMEQICKAVKRSPPYVRALADSGAIDSFVAGTGWRAFPKGAIDQIRAHERRKHSETVDA